MTPKPNAQSATPRAQSVDSHPQHVQFPHEEAHTASPKRPRASIQITNYFRPAHSEIRFGRMRFLITDRPTDLTIESYIRDLQHYRVSAVVRVCEPTYDVAPLSAAGLDVYHWEFIDGQPPGEEVIDKWLDLCTRIFSGERSNECIAVHCVAGLGRGPVLVGIALLEAGMKCDDAVFLIRSQRRGALNETQLLFLQQYKSLGRLRKLRFISDKQRNKSCAIM